MAVVHVQREGATALTGRTPSTNHSPNFDNLRRAVLRRGPPGPVPFFETTADPAMIEVVLGEKFDLDGALAAALSGEAVSAALRNRRNLERLMDMNLRFWLEAGYDCVPMFPGIDFPFSNIRLAADTAALPNWSHGLRHWQNEMTGPIQSWADFESYRWPKPEETEYAGIEYLNSVVPDGIKVSVSLGGILAMVSWLMGLQPLSYALYEQPDLVAALCERVGAVFLAAAAHVSTVDNVGMLVVSDDMGFSGGTLISPEMLRRYVFPYHRRLCETAHKTGRLAILHSCGNLGSVMDDVIDAGFDGKHSFEDKIMPVEEAYRRWGDQIAILGGLDMDLLARGSEEQVRSRTREVLDVCGAAGTGYALGTGNSVANYIPPENYLAMLDEGGRWNREHFGSPA